MSEPDTGAIDTGLPSGGVSDARLVEEVRRGDGSAFETLVKRYEPRLISVLMRFARDRELARDLAQETFCKAQMSLRQLREPSRVKGWLFSILRNLYLHRVRTEKNQPTLSLDLAGDLPEPTAEPLPDVEPEQLQQALNELPEAFRTPILLYYFDDFTYRDIAEQMDLPMGTVMSRLSRARERLRALLAAEGTVLRRVK